MTTKLSNMTFLTFPVTADPTSGGDMPHSVKDADGRVVICCRDSGLARWLASTINDANDREQREKGARISECPGCVAAHSGSVTNNDRHDEQCKAEHLYDEAIEAHEAAAQAWEAAQGKMNDGRNYFIERADPNSCVSAVMAAQTATGNADAATKAAPPNVRAFHVTVEALLAAVLVRPVEAIAAHRKAVEAYSEGVTYRDVLPGMTTPEAFDSALGNLERKELITQIADRPSGVFGL